MFFHSESDRHWSVCLNWLWIEFLLLCQAHFIFYSSHAYLSLRGLSQNKPSICSGHCRSQKAPAAFCVAAATTEVRACARCASWQEPALLSLRPSAHRGAGSSRGARADCAAAHTRARDWTSLGVTEQVRRVARPAKNFIVLPYLAGPGCLTEKTGGFTGKLQPAGCTLHHLCSFLPFFSSVQSISRDCIPSINHYHVSLASGTVFLGNPRWVCHPCCFPPASSSQIDNRVNG